MAFLRYHLWLQKINQFTNLRTDVDKKRLLRKYVFCTQETMFLISDISSLEWSIYLFLVIGFIYILVKSLRQGSWFSPIYGLSAIIQF